VVREIKKQFWRFINMSKVNAILEYEMKFNGWLKYFYEKEEEFLNDLNNEVKTNGVSDVLEYYKTYLKSLNDTNSTTEKRMEIKKLISLLEE
jgi:hypothetical protein